MFFKRKEPQFVLKVKQNRNEVFIIDELRIEAGDIETLVMQLEQACSDECYDAFLGI